MIITVNGQILNDPAGGITIDGDIVGLGLPPVRTSEGLYSGRDGGYIGSQFYGSRDISIPGKVWGRTVAEFEQRRLLLQNAVATKTITLTIITNAGSSYIIFCNLIKLDIPFSNNPLVCSYNLELIAADSIIYDNSVSGSMSVTVNPARGGGITWPITWPITWAAGSQPTTVNNTGNAIIYPTITLTDKMTNPTITNQTTGQFFTLTGLTTTAGDVLKIDMNNRTVLLNGGSVLPFVTNASSWWPLLPGNNSINLTTNDGTDTTVATVSWRSGYRGI